MSSDRQRQLEADIKRKEIELEGVNKDLDTVRGSVDEGSLKRKADQIIDDLDDLRNRLKKVVLYFPEVSEFDLQCVVRKCLNEILGKKKLVGFSMACSESQLLINFSERMTMKWGRATTQVVCAPALKPLVNKADWTSKEILRLKKSLETDNIVYIVRICSSNSTSDLAGEFWLMIQQEFEGDLNHCLMVMMVCDQDYLLPSNNLIPLSPPRFDRADLHEWFPETTKAPDEQWQFAKTEWINKMITICSRNDSVPLDFFLIYSSLKSTRDWLNKDPCPQKFLEFIDLL
jgi:hypothetical protein